jgi:starch phosphorylase
MLAALDMTPQVCHLNEGHAAFAVLERASSLMQQTGQSFQQALAASRVGNLFTTHTAVAAGFDRFSPELIAKYLSVYAQRRLGISVDELLALGRLNPRDASENFNMAYLAIRGSGAVNGVSRLHGEVSRHIFGGLFPGWPEAEVPVRSVTNGVHTPSWDSPAADSLWTHACGKNRWRMPEESDSDLIRKLGDAQLWSYRNASRQSLIDYARARLSRQWAASGEAAEAVDAARQVLDPKVLTIGFARRFATYKRPNLLLHYPARLLRLLTDKERPMQLILAGKAHPADHGGLALIRAWTQFIRNPEVRPHVIFLSDYDLLLTEQLVQGVDVWLNTPRRPWEACGTSGMKVLVNGGLNLSELDGWWAEAYAPEVGWAIGDGHEHGDDPAWDEADSKALYDVLEREVIPQFYARDASGIPVAWVARMRESMARLTPMFSSLRAVRDYTQQYYLPAAERYRERVSDNGERVRRMLDWRQQLERAWPALHFGEPTVHAKGGHAAGPASGHDFEVEVRLGELEPDSVAVELYADAIGAGEPERHTMTRAAEALAAGVYRYTVAVAGARPPEHYTPRLIPHFDGVSVPLEADRILWQR